ncbi:hypothetical protein, variant 2 [Exophiala oligosperma]|uniref:Uncharacterized protein n=1 Tax=Exophiala oligosperma TaxID=215243 RepID=A0A0D2DPY7_9EURO|nr:uncharacterized protein PV06_09880 [Exophiala oligosperma]XP_016258116.1 hypothetical protein, variant 1 [Exophiala oligosperma]XP_016258117.1 hypothetical protein, variant 2 [Exophiala oligosperma]KIW37899.1 hypothetical protein PV06_09880 [Exophiala oligosperma]KIW37900.1 hypothetical protein, variant 1 [Exophiala oligosperma]KIW37901.1 hypothetical protein, variant 2 [Exophiala oligosperma]
MLIAFLDPATTVEAKVTLAVNALRRPSQEPRSLATNAIALITLLGTALKVVPSVAVLAGVALAGMRTAAAAVVENAIAAVARVTLLATAPLVVHKVGMVASAAAAVAVARPATHAVASVICLAIAPRVDLKNATTAVNKATCPVTALPSLALSASATSASNPVTSNLPAQLRCQIDRPARIHVLSLSLS